MGPDETNPLPFEPPQPAEPVPESLEAVPVASEARGVEGPAEPPKVPASPQIPEDIRVPWDWIDLVIFALLAFGGTFVVGLGLVFVFSAFHVTMAQLRTSISLRTYFAVLNQLVLSFGLIGFMAAQVRARSQAPFWRTIGWRPLETGGMSKGVVYSGLIAAGLLLSLIVELLSNLSRPHGKLPIEVFFQNRNSALLLMVVSVVFAPFLEETMFRGYIYPALARTFGVAASVILTGTLFGMLHAPQLWGGWLQIALLIVVGILFTYARAKTHTVLTSYLLHLSYNSFLFFGFLVGSHWLRSMPQAH